MSRTLVVQHQGKALPLQLEKVDRTRLYGYVETEVLDETGKPCELAILNGDGMTLVGRGGTALAPLSPTGLWRERTGLRPVDLQGKDVIPVKSSFEAPIVLEKTATIDDYLGHNIHLVYRLSSDEDLAALVAELQEGTIYSFPFSYRGGLEAYTGFLLVGSDNNLFLAVGSTPNLQFVGLKQMAVAEDEDGMDFGMM